MFRPTVRLVDLTHGGVQMSNMVVRTNIHSLNAHRNMKNVGLQQNRAINRLSSGFRINSAADDAAGLAISESMRAQIRGLDQASRNAQDGQALVMTAEGGMSEITNMLIRIRELIVQAANDTYVGSVYTPSGVYGEPGTSSRTIVQRHMIQEEITQLMNEINSITQRLEFNSMRLLDGGLSYRTMLTVQAGGGGGGWASPNLAVVFYEHRPEFWMSTPTAPRIPEFLDANWAFLMDYIDDTPNAASFEAWLNAEGIMPSASTGLRFRAAIEAQNNNGEFVHTWLWRAMDIWVQPDTHVSTARRNELNHMSTDACGNFMQFVQFHLQIQQGAGLPITKTIGGNGLWLQLGANSSQGTKVYIGSMNTIALGNIAGADDLRNMINVINFEGVNISTQLCIIDSVLTYVTKERAKLGAVHNRLTHTMRSLDISSENLQDSESRVRNADMAREKMAFVKANVLQQAGVSMLSQANQLPNHLLQLLR